MFFVRESLLSMAHLATQFPPGGMTSIHRHCSTLDEWEAMPGEASPPHFQLDEGQPPLKAVLCKTYTMAPPEGQPAPTVRVFFFCERLATLAEATARVGRDLGGQWMAAQDEEQAQAQGVGAAS